MPRIFSVIVRTVPDAVCTVPDAVFQIADRLVRDANQFQKQAKWLHDTIVGLDASKPAAPAPKAGRQQAAPAGKQAAPAPKAAGKQSAAVPAPKAAGKQAAAVPKAAGKPVAAVPKAAGKQAAAVPKAASKQATAGEKRAAGVLSKRERRQQGATAKSAAPERFEIPVPRVSPRTSPLLQASSEPAQLPKPLNITSDQPAAMKTLLPVPRAIDANDAFPSSEASLPRKPQVNQLPKSRAAKVSGAPKPRPNYFLSLRLADHPAVVSTIRKLQNQMIDNEPSERCSSDTRLMPACYKLKDCVEGRSASSVGACRECTLDNVSVTVV